MAAENLVTLPDTTTVIDQRFLLEPLGGPQNPQSYLDRFPEEVYNKTIDSRLVKLIYSLIGPAGVGWLRKNYLEARLLVEEMGFETFDLDRFYGNPFQFGRIVEEVYDDDPNGLISREGWQRIKARDARYRNRAIDFINGARAGNTPEGMHLVARSGLGHEVEIIENYRALFDEYSDDPLGLPYYGQTRSTEEMIVLPRRELSRSEVQEVRIDGNPTGGTFRLFFPVGNEATHTTGLIPYDANRFVVQQYLEALPAIGPDDLFLEGGPLPGTPIKITFTGSLAARDVPELVPSSQLTGGTIPLALVDVRRSGIEATDEIVNIRPRDQRYLQEALDRIRPQTTISTVGSARGLQQRQVWGSATSTSAYTEVVRYVTGLPTIAWPVRDRRFWIESNVEHEGRRPHEGGSQHYQAFHPVATMEASSEHLGAFLPHQTMLYPVLAQQPNSQTFSASFALPPNAEPLTVTNVIEDDNTMHAYINGIYPSEYQGLPGAPPISPDLALFWASAEAEEGDEWLVIDLGPVQAVNHVYFETTRKPVNVKVEYDAHTFASDDGDPWREVSPYPGRPSALRSAFDFEAQNPWELMQAHCLNAKGQTIYTNRVRLTFTRREDAGSPFVSPGGDTKLPWSVEVRNLRVGRNVA